MTDLSELVAEYHYGDGHLVSVYAYYNTVEEYDNRAPSFFDCFDCDGVCLSEGDPWFTPPTWQQCAGYISPFIAMALSNEGRGE